MKFIPTIAAGLAAVTLVAAAPIADADVEADAARKFKVKSQVIEGKASQGNLYLTTYHTGAGLNVAVFDKNAKAAPAAHFNGTNLIFHLGNLDYGMGLPGPEDFYAGELCMLLQKIGGTNEPAGWGQTTIDGGPGQKGFALNKQGFIVNNNQRLGFEGWRICNWNHGVPELFHDTFEAAGQGVPSNCARVNLVPEYI